VLVNGTHVEFADGLVGIVAFPSTGAKTIRVEVDGNPNVELIPVLHVETGELRYFLRSFLQSRIVE
jgi:hypothetical protein